MTTDMHFGSAIPSEMTIAWIREINEYEKTFRDQQFARNFLPYRSIGPAMDADSITVFDTSSEMAQVIAKGAVPEPFTVKAKQKKHDMYCIATGFTINERDLEKPQGAALKNKEVDVGLDKIHAKEDYMAIVGDATLGLVGIQGAAQANTNGKITTATNKGAWNGSDDTRDIYEDVLNAINYMDQSFQPAYLLGNRTDLSYLRTMDSERVPFWHTIAGLFGKNENDSGFMAESQYVPSGYVYVIPYRPTAAEFVVSTDIDIDDTYAKQPGGNYWVEIKEWVCPIEVHENNAFVEIAIG